MADFKSPDTAALTPIQLEHVQTCRVKLTEILQKCARVEMLQRVLGCQGQAIVNMEFESIPAAQSAIAKLKPDKDGWISDKQLQAFLAAAFCSLKYTRQEEVSAVAPLLATVQPAWTDLVETFCKLKASEYRLRTLWCFGIRYNEEDTFYWAMIMADAYDKEASSTPSGDSKMAKPH